MYNFRIGLLRAFRKAGYHVVVIAPKDSFSSKLLSEGFSFYPVDLDNYGMNPLRDLRFLAELFRIYRKIRPEFIFHYTIKPNIYGSIAAYLNRIPSIAVTTGLGHLLSKNSGITLNLYRLCGRLSKEIWFLNEDDAKEFLSKSIVRGDRYCILPSEGVNTEYFYDASSHSNFPTTEFLFAGRLIKDKGIELLVSAAEEVLRTTNQKVSFNILGFIDHNNPNSISYEEIIKWQNAGILAYLGETNDVRKYIENCDCIIFPSFYREGVSRILLEAASMGKAIITTDNVGCREVVEHRHNGLICLPRDVESLVHQINSFLLLSKSERIAMGVNGRSKVKFEFEESLVFPIYLDKVEQIIKQQDTTKRASVHVP
jgi:glycosyltransferase involved in cell wall biosynthesis